MIIINSLYSINGCFMLDRSPTSETTNSRPPNKKHIARPKDCKESC